MVDGKKVVGVITEFNPFHKGHAHFLQEIRTKYGADYILAVMSGDFVQRGEPAFFSKFERAKEAVLSGVDLILQLPVFFSLSGSRDFGYGAVKLLKELQFVDCLVFGSECGDLERVKELASFLLHEEENPCYRERFRAFLSSGLSYPVARERALEDFFKGRILPNDTLGIAYLMAMEELSVDFTAALVSRDMRLPSAHALREHFRKTREKMFADGACLSRYLFYRLMELEKEQTDFTVFRDVSGALSDRIGHFLKDFSFCPKEEETFSTIVQALKGKNYTYSRVSRALLHILLDIRETDVEEEKRKAFRYYRALAVSKAGTRLLPYLPKDTIYSLGKSIRENPPLLRNKSFQTDLFAAKIYQSIAPFAKNEFREYFLKI